MYGIAARASCAYSYMGFLARFITVLTALAARTLQVGAADVSGIIFSALRVAAFGHALSTLSKRGIDDPG